MTSNLGAIASGTPGFGPTDEIASSTSTGPRKRSFAGSFTIASQITVDFDDVSDRVFVV